MFDIDLGNLYRRRAGIESRSITAENPDGSRGGGAKAVPEPDSAARDLGTGWKVRPCIDVAGGGTAVLADVAGPGVIRHAWFTFDKRFGRSLVLRVFWDGQKHPSVEVPLADFCCNGWNERQSILAHPVNVNPLGGMNLFFPMPFAKRALITVENLAAEACRGFFYAVNYTLEPVDADALAFHASWRRSNPVAYGTEYLIVDGIRGQGQYVGTFMSWQQNSAGWWGEGEIKMFLDDDDRSPTICGTGTEDYFGGAWGFGKQSYSAPYFGFQQVSGRSEDAGARMTLYRFHVMDPVFFNRSLRVTMQALGWRSGGRFLALQDDISSVAYWYQTLPGAPLEPLPDRDGLEISDRRASGNLSVSTDPPLASEEPQISSGGARVPQGLPRLFAAIDHDDGDRAGPVPPRGLGCPGVPVPAHPGTPHVRVGARLPILPGERLGPVLANEQEEAIPPGAKIDPPRFHFHAVTEKELVLVAGAVGDEHPVLPVLRDPRPPGVEVAVRPVDLVPQDVQLPGTVAQHGDESEEAAGLVRRPGSAAQDLHLAVRTERVAVQ
jgi:hypothetical protein